MIIKQEFTNQVMSEEKGSDSHTSRTASYPDCKVPVSDSELPNQMVNYPKRGYPGWVW